MKKLIIAMMLASTAAFADVSIPTRIQQLIDAKDWNALSTNNFNYAIVKTWQTADVDALVTALIQNKLYSKAFMLAAKYNSSISKLVDACTALAENNFIISENSDTMTIFWSNRLNCEEARATVLSTVNKLKQVLSANAPNGIKHIQLFDMYCFIIAAKHAFDLEVLPIQQISDDIIEIAAHDYKTTHIYVISSSLYKNYYIQLYSRFFGALPENSNIATKQIANNQNLTFFKHINKYYSNQFNDVLYSKSNVKGKIYIAAETGDADKLLDALENLTQDMLDAAIAQKILVIFNGQKADWRAADVLKALKNINSMYTIKLYDDRDAWEPVLSKLRAMIEVRQ